MEKVVAQRQVGQRPSDAGDATRQKHRLSFEVKTETRALFRDLQAAIRKDLGEEVDDDTLLLEVARRALGAEDDGRANYQVAVSRCDDCQSARIDAGGEAHPVDEAVAAMAECDAQHVGEVEDPHVGDLEPPPRATQTIPPATRRRVLRRDGKQCVVPGCRNHRFVDLHHLTPRSEGGTHEPDNLVTLCGAHHRAAHEGALVVEGSPAAGLRFRHADGTPYGAALRSPDAADLAGQVFTGLVNLGFKPTEARRRVARVQAEGTPGDLDAFLRRALR